MRRKLGTYLQQKLPFYKGAALSQYRDIFADGRNRYSVHVAGTCKIVLQRFYGAVAGNAAAGLPTDRTCRALLHMAAYHA